MFEKPKNIIIGTRPLLEAIESGISIDKVFIQKDLKSPVISEIKTKLKQHSFYYQDVPVEKLNRLSSKNHQGIIAFSSPISFFNLGNLLDETISAGKKPQILILDRISDVRNFGAICRSAEAFGFEIIVIPIKGAAQINEESIKTSAGAIFNIKICKEFDLSHTIEFLKKYGIQIVGISEKGKESIKDYHTDLPIALVLGSEEDGISPQLWNKCDKTLRIPLKGNTSSLNVSVAAGIAMQQL